MDNADKHRWSTWTHQEAANLLFHEDDYVVDLDPDAVVNIFPDDEEDEEDDNNEDDDQSEGNNGRTIVTKPLSALTLKKIQKLEEVFDQGVKESAKYTSEEEEAQKNCSHALAVETVKELDSFCEERGMDYQLQRQKFHELYQNLKRANNRELRLKIISQEILPAQLVAMDAKELAPEALKRKRESEAEKYFKQQVIIREDPNAPILRKTHKGIEVIGLIEANQGINSRTNTPIPLSPVDDDPQVIKSNPLAHIPWTNEMANILGQDQPISPSSNDNVEPPKKVRRTKEHQPEQEVASTSPASFVSLLFHPWNALVKYRKDLPEKVRAKLDTSVIFCSLNSHLSRMTLPPFRYSTKAKG